MAAVAAEAAVVVEVAVMPLTSCSITNTMTGKATIVFFFFFLVFWTALAWASTWVLGKGSVVEGDLFGLLFEK